MATLASARRSDYGMTCISCADELIAPEWSECVSERHVRHLWCCPKCGCSFEVSVYLPTDAEWVRDNALMEEFFPSLLVA